MLGIRSKSGLGRPGAPAALTRDRQKSSRAQASVRFLVPLVAISLLLVHPAAHAADFTPTLTQYAHTSWRVQDGDLGGAANGITQTKDGYIWVATEAGLERYDGMRFSHWKLPTDTPVLAVHGSRDGGLWVGQEGGIAHLHDRLVDAISVSQVWYEAFYEDRSGAMWVARTRTHNAADGALCKIQDRTATCFGAASGQPCSFSAALAQDNRGDLWLGDEHRVCAWRPGGGTLNPSVFIRDNITVSAFALEGDGSMLVGFAESGSGRGLQIFTHNGQKPFRADGLKGETLQVYALFRDRHGALWIGTSNDGIYHVDGNRVDHFTTADALSSNRVNGFFEDREGNVWAATSGGVDRFNLLSVSAFTTREGLTADAVTAVLARRDGSVWIGTDGEIDIRRNGIISRVAEGDLAGRKISSMLEDATGKVWVGVDSGLMVYDGRRFRTVPNRGCGALGLMAGLAEDDQNNIWALVVGRPYRLYKIHEGQCLGEIHLPSNAKPEAIGSADGAVWIFDDKSSVEIYKAGQYKIIPFPIRVSFPRLTVVENEQAILSTQRGAYFFNKGRWILIDSSRGLPCNSVEAGLFDKQGALWLNTRCGMVIAAKSDWDRFLEHPQEKLRVRVLDQGDGARSGVGSFRPAASVSPDGRLWFATDNVLLSVDPAHLSANLMQPPVHIEQLVADHRPYALGHEIALPPLTRDVEIDYAGLSLIAPQKVRFRYRLSGIDKDWQDVGTRRAAFYMNLKPGHYRFQVIACNNDGVWNNEGDTVAFWLRPAFYQTLWFRALALLLLVGLVWLGLFLRVRYVTSQIETRLSERQAERIRIARELHDTLLQGFQGLLVRFQVVADAIPPGESAKPLMEAVLDRADEILVEGRDRVRDLRSAEDHGSDLFDELERLSFRLESDGCVAIEVRTSGAPRPLNIDAQREMLSIAKEALTNACRHSRATAIFCDLSFTASRVRLVFGDNGVGIDDDVLRAGGREGHWGLTGMRERAREIGAVLRIHSNSDGTRIELSLNRYIAYFRQIGKRLSLLGTP